ncbi:hypothetical protein LACR_1165 [Lactococcus cremoris subsp. cremoris SK11]|uniref:Uncharacterized protein n=1 Tax=Lactococcus lactis subsp. cremoris (strain SK11) TaxID=272622 RepID=Q02ZC3_LACLS|nr:hypothetical protein LACR_1165 [Lactococcus cremoris subsp. cremoris SK11]KZK45355.1 hypothetical protein SK110_2018 [Lactococcus cremoris]KZK52682.1 hypothetical protein AM2_2019 [Lactococcus cremoris]MCT4409949.1 hypothetical protein [Lactococcus cremoris]MCT4421675.1 hypothetical protein [Lactococcus cremoris]
MIHTTLILSVILTIFCILLISFSAFVFLKESIKLKKAFLITTIAALSGIILVSDVILKS